MPQRNHPRCAASTPPTFPRSCRNSASPAGHDLSGRQAGDAPRRRRALNTHFRSFRKPMGLAVDGDRLAIGTSLGNLGLSQRPRRGPPPGAGRQHDACFLPRRRPAPATSRFTRWPGPSRTTALVRQHPLLLPVHRGATSTASCRAGGRRSSPPWPRRTAATSTDFAWPRAARPSSPPWAPPTRPAAGGTTRRDGGVLMDVATGEIILRGLSMPHSPRWYDGRSGSWNRAAAASAASIPAPANYQPVAELPGFTRGLDFCGPLAFIGLSQVRETAVFSGIAIAERPLEERCCGVWVVNIQTGQTVAFVKFEDAVQEIFAVQVLPGRALPRPDQRQAAPDRRFLRAARRRPGRRARTVARASSGRAGALAPGSSNQRLAVQTGG